MKSTDVTIRRFDGCHDSPIDSATMTQAGSFVARWQDFGSAKRANQGLASPIDDPSGYNRIVNGGDDLIDARFRSNISRINGLTKFVYETDALRQETPFIQDSKGVRADILRAVVVYLYATFEDALRTVARQNLADARPEGLRDIPFAGGTEQKLTLSQVAKHRSKSVAQLIDESVQSYLDGKSFSSFGDVVHLLKRLGLDTKPFAYFAKPLSQMMQRRHRIVHEGDVADPHESAIEAWTLVDNWQLLMWLLSVEAFYSLLRARLCPSTPKWQTRHDQLAKAMDSVVAFGNRLLDVGKAGNADVGTRLEVFRKMAQSVESLLGVLQSAKENPVRV